MVRFKSQFMSEKVADKIQVHRVRIGHASELGKGEVKPISVSGKPCVLFRDLQGVFRLWDAFCPHLGAHLGYGGKVTAQGLRCTFHGWVFSPEGKISHVPFVEKFPKNCRIKTWHVVAEEQVLFVSIPNSEVSAHSVFEKDSALS